MYLCILLILFLRRTLTHAIRKETILIFMARIAKGACGVIRDQNLGSHNWSQKLGWQKLRLWWKCWTSKTRAMEKTQSLSNMLPNAVSKKNTQASAFLLSSHHSQEPPIGWIELEGRWQRSQDNYFLVPYSTEGEKWRMNVKANAHELFIY